HRRDRGRRAGRRLDFADRERLELRIRVRARLPGLVRAPPSPGRAGAGGVRDDPRRAAGYREPPVSRGRLAVHGHFYQPSRVDPWTGRVPEEPSATPFHDWNARVDAECYRPNAARSNLTRISWDLGPPRASWLAAEDASTLASFARAAAGGNAIGQAFHHAILPLAAPDDRRTEVRAGRLAVS